MKTKSFLVLKTVSDNMGSLFVASYNPLYQTYEVGKRVESKHPRLPFFGAKVYDENALAETILTDCMGTGRRVFVAQVFADDIKPTFIFNGDVSDSTVPIEKTLQHDDTKADKWGNQRFVHVSRIKLLEEIHHEDKVGPALKKWAKKLHIPMLRPPTK